MTYSIKKYFCDLINTSFPYYDAEEFTHLDEKYFQIAFDNTTHDIKSKHLYKFETENISQLIKIFSLDITIEAVYLYRLQREIYIKVGECNVLYILSNLMKIRAGIEIYFSTKIGKGLNIQHGCGTVIGPRYTIGDNFTIHQGVTLGQMQLNSPNESIQIGDNVTLFAGSKVLGNIKIGDNVMVGANSVLQRNAESNTVYVGVPAMRVK